MENYNTNNNLTIASSDAKPEIFNFHGVGVRVLMRDGEPWFVAKDISGILGYSETEKMIRRLDADEKTTIPFRGSGSNYQTNISIINESGLYNAVLGSTKPNAREFRKWVTGEVLPSIRKTGGYLIAKKDESPEEIMARALLVAKETIDRQKRQIEQDRPKVQFADAVTASDTCITVGELAKLISQSTGYKTGRDRLFDWLRKAGWLISYGSSQNMPSQRGMERGFFMIHERTGQSGNGNPPIIFKTTKVTGKGQQYFLEYFNRENPL